MSTNRQASHQLKYHVFIRWIKDDQTSYDGDPYVTESLLEVPKRVSQARSEAEKRLQIGGAYGASSYKIVLSTISSVIVEETFG